MGVGCLPYVTQIVSHYRKVKIITEHIHVKHVFKMHSNVHKLPQRIVKLNSTLKRMLYVSTVCSHITGWQEKKKGELVYIAQLLVQC